MSPLTRREFVFLSSATCACLLSPGLATAEAASGPVAVGSLKDYAQDGVTDTWAKSHGFFLVRAQGRLYAASARCTHRTSAVLVSRPADKVLLCPQHGSRFDLSGAVTRGPARRPLPRLAISLASDGTLTVDPSRQFDDPADPAAFILIPPPGK